MAPLLVLEPGGSRQAAAEFFIAERLRGIPLVSRKSVAESAATSNSNEHQKQVAAKATAKSLSSEVEYGESGDKLDKRQPIGLESPAAELNEKFSESLIKNQVGKRDAPATMGQNQLDQGGILFRQTGITSAISNVVAAKTTTTTRKPLRQQTRTTTRRPPPVIATTTRRAPIRQTTTKRSTTTTSRRPKSEAQVAARGTNGAPLARQVKQPDAVEQTTTTTATTSTTTMKPVRVIEPISSHKMSTLEEAANSSPSLHSTLPFLIATTAASITQQQQQQQQHRTTLTRVMQTLTTQPVNQRRNQQNVVQSRGGSNKSFHEQRNGFAGENWYLFNRPDGNFSVFEILVLISNVLIVCTIILVILFNWIKMFKKRARALNGAGGAETQPKHQQQQLPQIVANNQAKVEPNTGDRASKMSFVSSQVSQATSSALDAMTTTTTSTSMMIAGAQKKPLDATAALGVRQQMAAVGEVAELAGRELVSSAQKMASEFQQAGANVANKAMAIVQPSENNFGTSSQLQDGSLDKLKRDLNNELTAGIGGRSISRSVSDLSPIGNAAASPRPNNGDELAATQRASANSTPDRVEALEKLFRNPPQRSKQKEAGMLKRETEQGPLLHSSSSLESIELPNQLVESIKRTATGPLRTQVDESLGPSPNLLLGEAVAQTQQQQDTMKTMAANGKEQLAKGDQNQSKTDPVQIQSPVVERPENPHMSEGVGNLEGCKMGNSSKESTTVTTLNKEQRQPMATIKEEAQKKSKPEAKTNSTGKASEQVASKTGASQKPSAIAALSENDNKQQKTADVKNHQVVVNRLDKRKTNLEIVDLRDASVTGKMRASEAAEAKTPEGMQSAWISMDGIAVVQPSSLPTGSPNPMSGAQQTPTGQQVAAVDQQQVQMMATMSPSEIIESRFHVDYKSKRRQQKAESNNAAGNDSQRQGVRNSESMDSKQEEYVFNNIENELELDNKMRNRKYFVYVVHDGHFTAKKECIARIELPPKRRITLAELRQLIANSQDISLTSLRRNRFKFVTETYRLLNENEDAAVLHQVYPTQGVFLKLNVAEQENQVYPFKGGRNTRLSSGGGGGAGTSTSVPGASSLSNTTIASRRRANARPGGARNNRGQDGSTLPAIEVNSYTGSQQGNRGARASSVGRSRQSTAGLGGAGAYKRSKSSVQMGRTNRSSAGAGGMRRGLSGGNLSENDDTLPSIGTSESSGSGHAQANRRQARPSVSARRALSLGKSRGAVAAGSKLTIGEAASDLGANMISGAKKLFTTTFGL